MKTLGLQISLMLVLLAPALTIAVDNMEAFPPAEEGMTRHVLHLEEKEDESLFQIELIVGKTVMLDEGNQYFFSGTLERETISGWGFPKYTLTDLGPMAGTLMAVDPKAKKVKRFITLRGDPYLIRYTSRLPIVIYVPQGVEVKYRLWSTEEGSEAVKEG